MLDLSKVKVSSSPHIRSDETTRQIMLDVVIALMPALAVSVFVFGWRSLVLRTKDEILEKEMLSHG